eukprot:g13681.t1
MLCIYSPGANDAAKQGNAELGKLLIDGKAALNIQDKELMTALIHAAKQGNAELGKLLIDGKAALNIEDKKEAT